VTEVVNPPDPDRRIFHLPGLGSQSRIERLSAPPSFVLLIVRFGMSVASGRSEGVMIVQLTSPVD
jgi:hypothetical protein